MRTTTKATAAVAGTTALVAALTALQALPAPAVTTTPAATGAG